MNHCFLYFALWEILLLFLDGPFWLFFYGIGFWYALKQYGKHVIVICCIVFATCLIAHMPQKDSIDSFILQIENIKSNYVIASDGKNKCLLYNVDSVDLLDVIEVDGIYEDLYSLKNRNLFQFETYMNMQGIYKSMYVRSYRCLNKSKHPRAFMHRLIKKHSICKDELESFFYKKQQGEDNFVFISGMHLHFLSGCLSKIWKKKKEYFDIGISVIYYLFFPVSSSIICMLYFALISILFHEKTKIDQCGITILVLLAFHSYMIYEIAFQLIVLFRLIIYFDRRHCNKKIKQFLILFPFQLWHFHTFYITEFLFFRWIRIIESLCFISGLVCICIPTCSFIFLYLFQLSNQIETWISSSFVIIGKPYFVWILYWCVLSVNYISNKKQLYLLKYIILLIIQLYLPFFCPFGEITFLDVGQGDCIYIKEPFSDNVLFIDIPQNKNKTLVENTIIPYLKMEGIKEIEKIIITHDDYDHSGGVEELKAHIEVKEVITKKRNQICMDKLCFYNVSKKNYKDSNDNSIVLFSKIGTLNYLFMADASKEVEMDILDVYNQLKIDVIKVGHHGSNTSSDERFIVSMHPLLSVISSGINNYYGHPHKEVIEILEMSNSYVLNTQDKGSITIFFTSFLNFMRTGSNEFGIMR